MKTMIVSTLEHVETTTVGQLVGGDTIRWFNRDWRVVNTPQIIPTAFPTYQPLVEVELYDGGLRDPIKITAFVNDPAEKIVFDFLAVDLGGC